VGKMMQYGLSAQRVTRVIRSYQRIEEGIAKDTVAVMQPNSIKVSKEGEKKWSQEIWVMYQTHKAEISNFQSPIYKQIPNFKLKNKKKESESIVNLKNDLFGKNQLKIISVWRYPGVSSKNNPIPEDILDELGDMI
jgi:hypothetical protein